MISQNGLDKLKLLFHEDGIELSDDAAMEAGAWLLKRIKAIAIPIPPEKRPTFELIRKDQEAFRNSLQNEKRM